MKKKIEKLKIRLIEPEIAKDEKGFIYEKIGRPSTGNYEDYTSRLGITNVILELQSKLNELIEAYNEENN